MTSMSKTISIEAAIAASQALGSAIKRRKDLIEALKSRGNVDELNIAVMEKLLQEDKEAFKEVAGYEWFD